MINSLKSVLREKNTLFYFRDIPLSLQIKFVSLQHARDEIPVPIRLDVKGGYSLVLLNICPIS